jgi:hypothetical protein
MDINAIYLQIDHDATEPLEYNDFRTHLTYSEVYQLIYSRQWKRRRGVLGKWHELKQQMYRLYLDIFYEAKNSQKIISRR